MRTSTPDAVLDSLAPTTGGFVGPLPSGDSTARYQLYALLKAADDAGVVITHPAAPPLGTVILAASPKALDLLNASSVQVLALAWATADFVHPDDEPVWDDHALHRSSAIHGCRLKKANGGYIDLLVQAASIIVSGEEYRIFLLRTPEASPDGGPHVNPSKK